MQPLCAGPQYEPPTIQGVAQFYWKPWSTTKRQRRGNRIWISNAKQTQYVFHHSNR